MTFKPKKQQIHVPGHGVVQKEDFTQEHFEILVKRAGRVTGGKDAFIKQHFEVASYDDQPLFKEPAETTTVEVEDIETAGKKTRKKKGESEE